MKVIADMVTNSNMQQRTALERAAYALQLKERLLKIITNVFSFHL